MGLMMTCNNCGHRQMIGHNAVDGRVKWWTECGACRKGNFMAPLPRRDIDLLRLVMRRSAESETGGHE